MSIPNVLADRYASTAMSSLWSAEGRVLLERDYWIAVMKAQRELGLAIPAEAIKAYEKQKGHVDLDSIRERERQTLHDVKARLDEFSALAGHQHAHKGLTSRDLTENVEQLQVFLSLQLVLRKTVALLTRLAKKAEEYKELPITGRTHNVPAQPTTLGKRLAMHGQEILLAARRVEQLLAGYPARGLKGAVGTQLDMLTLFGGDEKKVEEMERRVVAHLGMPEVLDNVGQVYPRSLDFEAVSALVQVGSGVSNFAKTLRLMAGMELGSEGFRKGQTGSSAMPHKVNSRSCERITGFQTILGGYLTMVNGLAGDQWNEGDVSCSVVRRVALPDAFFALDGLLETGLTILGQMEFFPGMIERENSRQMPFLATTTILMEAVKKGAGREDAHEAIKEHAIAVAGALRSGKTEENDLADRLAADERIGLTKSELDEILGRTKTFLGRATTQVEHFAKEVADWLRRHPEAGEVLPEAIL
ncbi:MAG: adenylosuccinate lyase [Opitutales bacterium]|nr:adenylosuccinate lyase [Opitutales bacterium]MCH8541297.1 adenylosuccinate lyase [Opitutales bacterium]